VRRTSLGAVLLELLLVDRSEHAQCATTQLRLIVELQRRLVALARLKLDVGKALSEGE